MIGGLWGIIVTDWLFVELLFVPEACRAKEFGAALMKEAEVIAGRPSAHLLFKIPAARPNR